jgi:hypothetical protein
VHSIRHQDCTARALSSPAAARHSPPGLPHALLVPSRCAASPVRVGVAARSWRERPAAPKPGLGRPAVGCAREGARLRAFTRSGGPTDDALSAVVRSWVTLDSEPVGRPSHPGGSWYRRRLPGIFAVRMKDVIRPAAQSSRPSRHGSGRTKNGQQRQHRLLHSHGGRTPLTGARRLDTSHSPARSVVMPAFAHPQRFASAAVLVIARDTKAGAVGYVRARVIRVCAAQASTPSPCGSRTGAIPATSPDAACRPPPRTAHGHEPLHEAGNREQLLRVHQSRSCGHVPYPGTGNQGPAAGRGAVSARTAHNPCTRRTAAINGVHLHGPSANTAADGRRRRGNLAHASESPHRRRDLSCPACPVADRRVLAPRSRPRPASPSQQHFRPRPTEPAERHASCHRSM